MIQCMVRMYLACARPADFMGSASGRGLRTQATYSAQRICCVAAAELQSAPAATTIEHARFQTLRPRAHALLWHVERYKCNCVRVS